MGFARIKEFDGNKYVYWIEAHRDKKTGKPKQNTKYLCKLDELKIKFKAVLKWIA